MNHILNIVENVILLIIVFGGGGWLFICALKSSEDPVKTIFKLSFSIPLVIGTVLMDEHIAKKLHGDMLSDFIPAAMMVGSVAVTGLILGVTWGLTIGNIAAKPLTNIFDGGNEPPEPKPLYSIALSKRKLNRPLEAIVAIREQLAKFPNDFEGVTLLANIQAEDMKDLPSAEITFDHFCNLPTAPPKQAAAAWTQMADWHLKLAQDSDSARAALEKIIAKFPDSELSLAAAQRVAHLDGTVKQLLAAHDRQRVFVPEGIKNIGLLDSSEHLIPTEADPEKLAADFVKHLERHPLDSDARVRLAIIYARHYKRLDLAALELNQLIEQPNQPHKRVAHWLNLLADLQIQGGADYDEVRGTLLKIVEQFPDSPVAQIARSRLDRLKMEFKGKEETPGKKLGVYEQNIGLKYGPTYGSPR
jgi:tetratricopeptide (TPR) repeat protein